MLFSVESAYRSSEHGQKKKGETKADCVCGQEVEKKGAGKR